MITIAARRLFSLNKQALRFAFCFSKAHLDPYKHTTMSHSPHNMFVDLYDFGEYPEVIINSSISPRTYQPIVVSTTVDILNQRFGTSLTVDDFNNNLEKSWSRFILKNLKSDAQFDDVISPVLNRLSIAVFVKESRWTWVKEQKERLSASKEYFSASAPETLGDFLDQYNFLIEKMVLISTFGRSPYIPQAPTALEKHFVEQMADRTGEKEGVEELNQLQGANNNFINRTLSYLHKL